MTTPEPYRPNLTRTWPRNPRLPTVITPTPPPKVKARVATDAEQPKAVRDLAAKLRARNLAVVVGYAVTHDDKASVTIYAVSPTLRGIATWELTDHVDKHGIVAGKRLSNHTWPHRGRATSLCSAKQWSTAFLAD